MAGETLGQLAVAREAVEASTPVHTRQPVPPEYIERNRLAWNRWAATTAVRARQEWLTSELEWGLWNTPESELRLLDWMGPGSDAIELGCGAAGLSSWLKRHGLNPVAVDFSRPQLDRAGELQREFQIFFPLVHANAEEVPYDHDSFDVAVSDYGASVWCDPVRWLPEARRLLHASGLLIFFTPSPIMLACTPVGGGQPGTQLEREYFSLRYMEFGETAGVEFHLTYGAWARLLHDSGFVVEDIIETRPSPNVEPRYPLVESEWARHWPTEVIWIARAVPRVELKEGDTATRA